MKNEEKIKEKCMRKLILELKIDNCIETLKKTVQDGWDYFENPLSNIEKNDLIERLDESDLIFKDLDNLLEKLTKEYEKDIKELENEQLQ